MNAAPGRATLTQLLENGEDNLLVILAEDEVDVDRILASIASANTNLVSRGRTAPRFTILGNARWNRYANLDRTMFFKNRIVFLSTYHAKRDSETIKNFDSEYIKAFGPCPRSIPTGDTTWLRFSLRACSPISNTTWKAAATPPCKPPTCFARRRAGTTM